MVWAGTNERSVEDEVKERVGGEEAEPGRSRAHKRERGYYLFENHVEQIYSMLEQIIDYQNVRTEKDGVDMKVRLREHLEGWEFIELATGHDATPRVATLHALGWGWVDFIRSIGALPLSVPGGRERAGRLLATRKAQSCSGVQDQEPAVRPSCKDA